VLSSSAKERARDSEHISVREMASIVFPAFEPSGYLAVLRGYFDESYRGKRVYAIGGYIARDKEWKSVSHQWRNRRLRDGIQCFHATDCESGFGEFEHLSKEQRTTLKADLIQIVDEHEQLGGFASAVMIEDFFKVQGSSERAREVLGPDPYFLCFQMALSSVCKEFERQEASAHPGVSVALIFEDQEEFSGRAKTLYDKFKALNKSYAANLGTLTYAPKDKFVPLEIADNLAYETMKEILNNKFEPTRARRIAMEKMLPRIRMIDLLTEMELRKLVLAGRTSKDYGIGIKR
jgi:hypothetical protein